MSRYATALQKSRDIRDYPDRLPVIPTPGQHAATHTGLIARLFAGPDRPSIVAFVSALPGEGVTRTTAQVAAEVESSMGFRTIIVCSNDLGTKKAEGSRVLGAAALASYDRNDTLLDLANRYDVVFVDAGSIAQNPMALELSRKASVVVMVVEAGRTRKSELKAAVAAIRAAQGQIAGYVLNKQKRTLPAWLERWLG